MKSFQKVCIALALLPITLASFYHFILIYSHVTHHRETLKILALGAIFYVAIEFLFKRPMRTYVLGHEFAHALATWLCGGKVYSFKVTKNGGHVMLSKSNFFISLAPYCFPIYTLFGLLLYWGLGFYYPVQNYEFLLIGFVGASLAFHISLTIFAIRQGQPDIRGTGVFFSLVFILLCNIWILIVLSKLLFPGSIALNLFAVDVWNTQMALWYFVAHKIQSAFIHLNNLIVQ